ncbi:MAG: hypothetical protein COA47_16265 [Robiginitomaculum sp.]|nr:MAG: hypothetical protein COA47_16265 [Robiginitomaculum sp.]
MAALLVWPRHGRRFCHSYCADARSGLADIVLKRQSFELCFRGSWHTFIVLGLLVGAELVHFCAQRSSVTVWP